MKLRRILAGFLAGAIAMTSSVVMSVTAGAEETEVSSVTYNTYLDEWNNNCCVHQSTHTCESGNWSDYTKAVLTMDVSNADSTVTGIKFYGITSSWGEVGTAATTFISSGELADTLTLDLSSFSEEDLSTMAYLVLRIETTSTEKLSDLGISDIKITLTRKDGVVIATKDVWEKNTDGKWQITYSGTENVSIPDLEIPFSNYTTLTSDKIGSVTLNYTYSNATWSNGGFGFHDLSITDDETTDGDESWVQKQISASETSATIELGGCKEDKLTLQSWYGEANAVLVIDGLTITEKADTTYPITIEGPFANGTITSDKETAKAGDKVTLTVTPAENYQLKADALIVTVEAGVEQVDVTDNKNGTYSFTMPECNVAVYAEFIVRQYKLTINEVANGKILFLNVNTTAHETAPEGAIVEMVPSPEDFYTLGGADIKGVTTEKTFTITGNSFTMPAEDVIITPKFVVDVALVKSMVDSKVEDYATVTKPSTYTVADYKAELENAVAGLVFKDITVDTSALKETKSTTDATGSITGTVTFKAGEETITTLTANVTLDKVPTNPVAIAAEAVETYLAKVTFDNDFHATNQSEAIKAEVKKVAPEVRVDASFTVKLATEEAEGSVKGRIMLVADDSELKTIEVNKTIAKLPAKDLVYADNQEMLVALKADGTVLTQKATQADGKLSQRFVKKINKADLEGAKEIQYKFSDGTKSLTKTDTFYYETVAGVPSGETEVFLSATMKNIPVGAKVTCEITIIK